MVRAMDYLGGLDLCSPRTLGVIIAEEGLGDSMGGILQLPEGCCQDGNERKQGWWALQLWFLDPRGRRSTMCP